MRPLPADIWTSLSKCNPPSQILHSPTGYWVRAGVKFLRGVCARKTGGATHLCGLAVSRSRSFYSPDGVKGSKGIDVSTGHCGFLRLVWVLYSGSSSERSGTAG